MELLVVGASGLLGQEVVARARRAGWVVGGTFLSGGGPAVEGRPVEGRPVNGVSWHRLDITDRAAVADLVARVRPQVVVNAAYRQADWVTTADGAMHVAAAAAAVGARLVHVSSDAVFSARSGVYDESCPPCPGTVYGAAKAAAETAVRGLVPGAVIARTSLIVADRPTGGVVAYVHALARGAVSGVLFTDDVRCPIGVGELAAALLDRAAAGAGGVCHLAGGEALSRYELGLRIARRDGLDGSRLRAGRRAESGLPGARDVRLVRGSRGSSGRPVGS